MKSSNKKILTVLSLSALLACGAVVCTQIVGNAVKVPAQNETYEIQFNDSQRFSDSSSAEASSVVKTVKSNNKTFKHKGVTPANETGKWGTIATNGYLRNTTKIDFLGQLIINFDSENQGAAKFRINISRDGGTTYSDLVYRSYNVTANQVSITIDVEGVVDYFKLTVEEGSLAINSMQLTFKCDENASTVWNSICGVTPTYDQEGHLIYGYYPQDEINPTEGLEGAIMQAVSDKITTIAEEEGKDYEDGRYIWIDQVTYTNEDGEDVTEIIDNYYCRYKVSEGSSINNKYFECQPIKWNSVGNSIYDCTMVLNHRVAFESEPTEGKDYSWTYSNLRKWLTNRSTYTGAFQMQAFAFDAGSKLNTHSVVSSDENYVWVGTDENFFNSETGWYKNAASRQKVPTDFAYFKGANKDPNYGTSNYWTSSYWATATSDQRVIVTYKGERDGITSLTSCGVSPAIQLKAL